MSTPNRLAGAEARIEGMIDNLQPDQSMTLIAVADVPRVLTPRTGDHFALRQALASVEPTPRTANLPAALSLAASLAGDRPNVEAVVVGDPGLSSDRSQVPAGLPFPVRYVTVGGAAENLAVAAFGTRRDGDALAALARIANDGVQSHQVTVDLQVDGLAQPPQQVSVEAGQSADVQWNDLPASAQQLEARIEQPDALALDNAAWVVLGGQQATRVLLVTDGNTFLERALELRPGVSVVRGSPADYAEPAGSARYDLVVFDGFIPPTLPASGSLLLVDPPASSSLANVGDELPVPSIRASGAGSPLLANVALDTIHINRTRELDLPAWADAIVETPDTPLLIAGERQGQRVAVLGFDLHQSDLPLQPAFPVLVQNLLDWLVPGGGVASPTIRAGQSEGLVAIPRRAVDRRRRTRRASNVDRPALSATVVRPDRSARSLYRGAAGHQRRAGLVDLRGELLRAEPIPPGRGRCNRGERFGAERGVRPAGAARGVGRRRRCHARVADAGVVGGLPLLSTMVPFQVGQPLVLLLLLPLVAFVGLVWQRSTHPPRSIRTRLLLGSRLVAGVALVLALAEISFHGSVSRQAVVFVADVSSSTDAARQSEQDFVTRAIAAKQTAAARNPSSGLFGGNRACDEVLLGLARGAVLAERRRQRRPPGG